MNRFNLLTLALVGLMACSKSSDPAASATVGCSVLFKGTTYALTTATCLTTGGEQYMTGINSASPTTSPTINLGKTASVGDYITFFTDASDVNTLYSSVGLLTEPTITISGKTWTFSAQVANSMDGTDVGTISGTCTCN